MTVRKIDEAFTYARNAGADLSSSLYLLAKIDSDGDIVLCGDGEKPCGTIIEAAAENDAVTVAFGSIVPVKIGASGMTAGNLVASHSDGTAVVAGVGDHVLGVLLEDADSGSIGSVLVQPGARHA